VAARWILLIPLIACHFAAAQQVIEEVVAVIGPTPILRSDVTLAQQVRLIDPDPEEPPSSYWSRLVDARIRLELQYRDLVDSGTLYRLKIDLDSARAALVSNAGGVEILERGMAEAGLISADLEELALRVAAANAYTDQRLRPRIRVSLEELQSAYHEVIVDELEAAGLEAPPIADVREELHRLLVERKLNLEIESWLASAADRHEVTRFVR
jgi:hypothetical protein